MTAKSKRRWRFPEKEFEFIYHRGPRFCVDAVICARSGVALIRRAIPPDLGKWNFPGGTLRRGETLDAAVKRFARDEAGLKVRIEKCLGPIEYFRKGRIPHMVSIAFLARPVAGKLAGGWQGKEAAFFRIAPKNMVAEQRKFLIRNNLISSKTH